MNWLDYEHMTLNNKLMTWDAWVIYNPYSTCTKKLKNYDCGPFAIRFIDLDTLGELLSCLVHVLYGLYIAHASHVMYFLFNLMCS